MTSTQQQRRLLSAARRGVLLLGLAASLVLAIAAATMSPSWSPLPRGPLPASPSLGVDDRVVAQEQRAVARGEVEPRVGRPAATLQEPVQESIPAPSGSQPIPPPQPAAEPEVVVSVPTLPVRRPSAPKSDPTPAPTPPPAEPAPRVPPAPPAEAAPPPAEPPPSGPEAVVSTHPGQGNAYGKGNGSGPPDGVPPGQVGR